MYEASRLPCLVMTVVTSADSKAEHYLGEECFIKIHSVRNLKPFQADLHPGDPSPCLSSSAGEIC